MLHYLSGKDLENHPKLAASMFRDRAKQFQDRLNWGVTVDASGEERDEYDSLQPLYVIWQSANGNHGGSMRFLPTTGRTMAREKFGHLNGSEDICSPFIWECTRFCLAPSAGKHVAAALMLGGSELMRAFAVSHFLGIFDDRMVRVYKMLGASPDILGGLGEGRDRISLGLWAYSQEARSGLLRRSGVTEAELEEWFERSFGRARDIEYEIAI